MLAVIALSYAMAGEAAPPLPPGLGGDPTTPAVSAPALPPGLSPGAAGQDAEGSIDDDTATLEVSGFWEYRYGQRVRSTDLHGQTSLNETRLHLATEKTGPQWSLDVALDLVYDDVAPSQQIDLQTGDGWLDLRRLDLLWQPIPDVDIRAGRQILTWGTGDLVFLNDIFPKDWRYYLGRDIEYSKAPSDAVKISWYKPIANVDVVYSPRFDASRYVNGERLSFWNDIDGRLVGRDDVIAVDRPDDWFEDDELAIRLFRNYQGVELALYGFDGFYKSPVGYDPSSERFFFPRLRTLGASARTPLGPGILSLEFAYWQSRDDRDGTNPFIENGENRYLVGYEWEAMRDFTINVQYYAEQMRDHDAYLENLPTGSPARREVHDYITLRLTRLLLNQDLKLSWFSYYTPRNRDIYIRPEVLYKISDEWSVAVGANWFDNGDGEPYADLGQFKYNSNVYGMIRYSFAGGI